MNDFGVSCHQRGESSEFGDLNQIPEKLLLPSNVKRQFWLIDQDQCVLFSAEQELYNRTSSCCSPDDSPDRFRGLSLLVTTVNPCSARSEDFCKKRAPMIERMSSIRLSI